MIEYSVPESELEAKTISFLGVDKYDIILYLARILRNLDYRVLVIDISESGALNEALYDTSDSQVVMTEPCIYSVKGIDFIPRIEDWSLRGDFYNQYLYHTSCDYDYILIDYGFNISHTAITKSKLVLLISDMQKHNINIMRILLEQLEVPKQIIIRDVVPCKIKAKDLLIDHIRGVQNFTHYLEIDVNDLANMIQIQHTRSINTKRCSRKMKDLLCGVVNRIDKKRTKKEIMEALSATWRGK